MATVISITVTESSEQLIHGIPKTVTITTSIPSTIFYTLDETIPTTSSSVVVNPLELPTNQNTVVLKLFATDGTDTSPVITKTYRPDIVILRQSHDKVTGDVPTSDSQSNYPYGDPSPSSPIYYGNIAEEPINTDGSAPYSSAYDGTATGTRTAQTNQPLDTYPLVFSETDITGERGRGIGTLPAEVTIKQPDAPPETTDMNSRLFNPKALVIYQDNTEEPFDPTIRQTNRHLFSLENPEKVKDGTLLTTTGLETQPNSGSLVRAVYNHRENTITYYYFDSQTLRWIISKEPYQPAAGIADYSQVFPSRKGGRYVYEWRQFVGRRLI